MANTIYNGAISGESFVVGPQVSHGGIMNIHFANRTGPVTAIRKPFSDLPHPSGPDYIDRPIITNWLQKKLNKSPSRAALVGLGGIGKSKLAIRYAEQLCKESPDTYIFWINSATKDTFVQGFRRISEKLGLPNAYGASTDMLMQVFNWLRDGENGQWVMILDNADDYFVFRDKRTNSDVPPAIDSGALDSFLPQTGNGRILITSRSQDTTRILALGSDNILVVQEMEEHQARLLFSKKLGDFGESDEISRKVVLALNCIPLCISQAAAYIHKLRPRMTCAKYLEKLENRNFIILGSRVSKVRHNPDAKNQEVEIKTWQITFDQIRLERRSAAELLSLMSFFQPQGIPDWVLQKHYSEMDNEDSSIDVSCNDEDEFEDDLTLLRDYSLVTVAQDGRSFQMHSLVQSFTRSWLEASHEDHKWRRCFWRLMIKNYPEVVSENWGVCGELTPHIEPLVNTTSRQLEDVDEAVCFVELLHKVGLYNDIMAMYETALRIVNKAEQLAVQKLGQHHEQVYRISITKARILGYSGSVAAAVEAALGAYRGLTSLLGLDNPNTHRAGDIYALSLVRRGKLDEAQAIYVEMLESQKRVTGPEFIGSSVTLKGLGIVAYRKGDYKEAERLYRQVYQCDMSTDGLTSLNTLGSLYSIANVLVKQEKWAEAEPIINEVVEGHNEILGPEHPSTLLACNLQASNLVYKKRFKEAEDIRYRILEAQKKVLGLEHPETIWTLSACIDVLAHQDKWDEAEGICRQILETQRPILGPEHPDTLGSLYQLGIITHQCGRSAEAMAIIRQVSELQKRVLGPEHPDTLESFEMVGYLDVELGQLEEADDILHELLELRKRVLGPEHPKVLDTLGRLAFVSSDLRRYEEAESIFREHCQLEQKIRGPTHPDTLENLESFGAWYVSIARYKEAEEIFRQLIELRKQVLLSTHGDVLRVAAGIVRMLKKQGKNEEAKLMEDEWQIYVGEDGWDCTSSLCDEKTHRHPEAEWFDASEDDDAASLDKWFDAVEYLSE